MFSRHTTQRFSPRWCFPCSCRLRCSTRVPCHASRHSRSCLARGSTTAIRELPSLCQYQYRLDPAPGLGCTGTRRIPVASIQWLPCLSMRQLLQLPAIIPCIKGQCIYLIYFVNTVHQGWATSFSGSSIKMMALFCIRELARYWKRLPNSALHKFILLKDIQIRVVTNIRNYG